MSIVPTSGNLCLKCLSDKESLELHSSSHELEFAPDERIIRNGSPVQNIYYLKKGIVELFMDGKPHPQPLHILINGEFVGINCVFSSESYHFSARALTPCTIEVVNKDVFTKLLQQNGAFSLAFIHYISAINENFMTWHFQLKSKNSAGALAYILLEFANSFGSKQFELPLTRQEIARVIGFSKESVLKNLAQLRSEGIIGTDGKKFNIQNEERLKNIATYG